MSIYGKKTIRSVLAGGAFVVALILCAPQQSGADQNMPTGKAFIAKVAQINVNEQQLGHLAEQKGSKDAVKDFGKRMVEDHSHAESQLKKLAERKGVTLPAGPDAKASSLEQQLSAQSGTQFDRDYLEHMIAGHKQAIALLKNEIQRGKDPAIKAYAKNTLPTIQEHLRLAESAAGKNNASAAADLH